MKDTIKFGVIGCGLMGREFASAAERWCHLNQDVRRPEIVAVCDIAPQNREWFTRNVSSVKYSVSDYRELLAIPEVEAVYCALPHNLHAEVYCAVIRAGKHLMGEKPFGIDKAANQQIMAAIAENPQCVVRCASEFPFYPAMQLLISWIRENRFGRILEIKAGFCHSSDLDPQKPINWKRMVKFNGEYGCMGDLGIHTLHVPLRMGFVPKSVYAALSKYVTQRPNGRGGMAQCDTWDNATLLCECADGEGNPFPMYLETKRMEPGATNNWYFEIYGMDCSAKFSSAEPNYFSYTVSWGKEQAWTKLNVGYKPMIPTITGGIFEFGFTDAILQMWGAFCGEIDGKTVPFGCCTPEEAAISHKLYTAALQSHEAKCRIGLE